MGSVLEKNFGGIDAPEDRKDAKKFREASLPEKFAPTLNPFYVALPFNDIAFPKKISRIRPVVERGGLSKGSTRIPVQGPVGHDQIS